jgi:hypothetical protein
LSLDLCHCSGDIGVVQGEVLLQMGPLYIVAVFTDRSIVQYSIL